jgi:hypothetical protein
MIATHSAISVLKYCKLNNLESITIVVTIFTNLELVMASPTCAQRNCSYAEQAYRGRQDRRFHLLAVNRAYCGCRLSSLANFVHCSRSVRI